MRVALTDPVEPGEVRLELSGLDLAPDDPFGVALQGVTALRPWRTVISRSSRV